MNIFRSILLGLGLIVFLSSVLASEEITPYKFPHKGGPKSAPHYDIPPSSRFTVRRLEADAPDIVYYFTKAKGGERYPIALVCGGSSSPDEIDSIIHVHRYLLQEFMDAGAGVLTVEQWGVDGNKVHQKEFMDHYTRSERLKDHKAVIAHLKLNPPSGWNGKLIFLGVSEGGPIVTTLTTDYPEITLATINWSGAGDWAWREELWVFLQDFLSQNPECPQHHKKLRDCKACSEPIVSRERYDAYMNDTVNNPTAEKYFLNMTYKYHADALNYPPPSYQELKTPFLVVAGTRDSIISSSDAFVQKAKNAGCKITYLRIDDMDHYVARRPDIIKQSFQWLREQMRLNN
ncbi:alpha/beta hydrolase family protein [Caedimonas varicaedens]|uniref:Alpha/beta hydrolase family protein n=1 Tax=Caedimonas varicaedens TaxID=1629334 RepID=A0A0K8MAX8_9PROT|nr:alpha/beta hydrolase family protein [Caedimonas varicaedens]